MVDAQAQHNVEIRILFHFLALQSVTVRSANYTQMADQNYTVQYSVFYGFISVKQHIILIFK